MQEALDHLEKHKVFVEAVGVDMIYIVEAYKAVELSMSQQLQDTLTLLQEQLGGLVGDLDIEEEDD